MRKRRDEGLRIEPGADYSRPPIQPMSNPEPLERRQPFASWPAVDRWLAIVVFASAVLIPVFFLPFTDEIFRLPKLLLFRAEGLILLAVFAIGWLWNSGDIRSWRPRRTDGLLVAAIVVWSAVATLTSTHRALSVRSLLTVISGAAVFLAACRIAPRLSPRVMGIVFVPALINAGVLFLQVAGVPITFAPEVVDLLKPGEKMRLAESALLGNRNDVGSYLQFLAALAWAGAFWRPAPKRTLHAVVAAVLTCAVLVSRTVTAIAALAVSVLATLLRRSWKRALVAGIVAIVLTGIFAARYEPLRLRIGWLKRAVSAGRLDRALSGRPRAYLAAARMTADHPLTGVGPGRYSGHFFDYVLIGVTGAEGPAVNFGETHNDYLQTMAETGVPGLVLMLAAIGVFVVTGARPPDPGASPSAEYARQLSLALGVSFAVLALAQFPLQLAAPSVTIFTVAGLLRGWLDARA